MLDNQFANHVNIKCYETRLILLFFISQSLECFILLSL